MSALAAYREAYAALPQAPQPWLRALKQAALQRAEARGLPTLRDEAWKYSSVSALEKRGFKPVTGHAKLSAADLEALTIAGLEGYRAVFVSGRFDTGLSRLPSGLHITSLGSADTALQGLPVIPTEWDQDSFTDLNTALFQDGLLLELDAGVTLDQPLELLHVSLPHETAAAHHLRSILKLGDRAKAFFVERYAGLEGAKHLTNSVTQIELGVGAELTHVRLQQESAQAFHVGRVLVQQAAGSQYRSHNLQTGALWSRLDIATRLNAAGATAELQGLYAVDGRQHIDNHTRIEHQAPGTVSRELYRGILAGQGRAVFNGKVLVAKHAVKTDAQQANHNLILSRGAEIDTKPELEIYADDVKCSHGATIGQLDEQQLFYLRSRGLDEAAARQLLIAAFAERLLATLPHPALAAQARRLLGAGLTLPEPG